MNSVCAVILIQALSLLCLSMYLQIWWKTNTHFQDHLGVWMLQAWLMVCWALTLWAAGCCVGSPDGAECHAGIIHGLGRGYQENQFTGVLEPCQILTITTQSSLHCGIAGISFLLSHRIRP